MDTPTIEIKQCYIDCMLNMTTCKLSKYVVDEREKIYDQPIRGHYEPGPNCPGPGVYELHRKGTGKWISNEELDSIWKSILLASEFEKFGNKINW